MNLALNALDATPTGGRVRIEVRADGGDVLFTIDDSGPGIPAEVLEHIFEPFFTTKAAGSGLGLAIVRATAERHGGRATVSGSRFAIELPALPRLSESGATTRGVEPEKGMP